MFKKIILIVFLMLAFNNYSMEIEEGDIAALFDQSVSGFKVNEDKTIALVNIANDKSVIPIESEAQLLEATVFKMDEELSKLEEEINSLDTALDADKNTKAQSESVSSNIIPMLTYEHPKNEKEEKGGVIIPEIIITSKKDDSQISMPKINFELLHFDEDDEMPKKSKKKSKKPISELIQLDSEQLIQQKETELLIKQEEILKLAREISAESEASIRHICDFGSAILPEWQKNYQNLIEENLKFYEENQQANQTIRNLQAEQAKLYASIDVLNDAIELLNTETSSTNKLFLSRLQEIQAQKNKMLNEIQALKSQNSNYENNNQNLNNANLMLNRNINIYKKYLAVSLMSTFILSLASIYSHFKKKPNQLAKKNKQ